MDTSPTDKSGQYHPSDDDVLVGKVAGPWGLKGDLKVVPFTDSPLRFSPGSRLLLDGRPTHVVRSRATRSGLVVNLDTVGDRESAELLRDASLTVHRDELAPLPDGSYYHYQIMGMGVWTEEGEYLGKVWDIVRTGASDVYVVRDDGGLEVLVPSLKDVVLDVFPGEGRMVVRLPEGLR